ncbi:MAG: C40 family peptidase [candidate division KSB1 bacterium]|nr:C40 family peptidase [candidate division KSB1 bacterium]
MTIKPSFTIILAIFILLIRVGEVDAVGSQIAEMVSSIDGLVDGEADQLVTALTEKFEAEFGAVVLDDSILANVKSIVSACIFEEASHASIAEVALKSYHAIANGAPAAYIEDLSLIGLSYPVTEDQLRHSAMTIEGLMDAGVDSYVIEELISYGIYNGWSGTIIKKVGDGLIRGAQSGLSERKLALALIIGVDQDAESKSIDIIVQEGIDTLRKSNEEITYDTVRRDIAYEALQRALMYQIPRDVAQEMYLIAVRDKWPTGSTRAVFDGLIRGNGSGLSPEKLATDLIIRMAQDPDNPSPEEMVEESIAYVKQLEKKRLSVIQADEKKYRRTPKPVDQDRNVTIDAPVMREKNRDKPVTYYPTANRRSINAELMKQSIQEFLGPPATPYRWGGSSRRGVDCSGFTQLVYKAQGIYLPRNSRQQVKVGMPVSMNALQFGDLIFFSKYFNDYITHVGIYIGNNKFVHASCTKGVTISDLNKKYYMARWRKHLSKRIVY